MFFFVFRYILFGSYFSPLFEAIRQVSFSLFPPEDRVVRHLRWLIFVFEYYRELSASQRLFL